MFPQIGFSEMLLIGLIALIVVGPKDLPLLMRKAGQAMNKLRQMAGEFRASFDELARQAEIDELRREVDSLRRGQPFQDIRDAVEAPFDLGIDEGGVDSSDATANRRDSRPDVSLIDAPQRSRDGSSPPSDGQKALSTTDAPPAEGRL